MVFKKFFGKKLQDRSDYGKLRSGMIFLSKKTQECFDEEDFENLNAIELGIFFGAFNSACYIFIKDKPFQPDLEKFEDYIVSLVADQIIQAQPKKAPNEEIEKLFDVLSKMYKARTNEYLELILKELDKPRRTSGLVDLTEGIMKYLFDEKQEKEYNYNVMFSAILSNHINAFGKLLS